MLALVSAVGRERGGDAIALLIVYGINPSSWVRLPREMYAVAVELFFSLNRPEIEPLFRLLFGHSVSRPLAGPDVGVSVERRGLSQTSVGVLLLKNDPS